MKPHRFKLSKYPPKRFLPVAAIIFLFFLSHTVVARTIAEYRQNVADARIQIDELIDYDDEAEDGKISEKYFSQTITAVKNKLPAERLEWQGAVIETDYQWLAKQLDEAVKETGGDKRNEILNAVSQRLEALQLKMDALDKPASAGHSKDEDKQKLAEILRREEYQKAEKKDESLFQKWYRSFMEWLENLFPKPDIPQGVPNSLQGFSYVLQIFLYAVIIGVIGFLLYKFAPFIFKKYRRREKRQKKDRIILGETVIANETSDTLFDEAEKLAREGNLRGAIRKGYIALLCELSDRKIIGLAQYKTNRDYLRDVRQRREIYENMNGLTDSFERHWYGFQTAEQEDWNEFRQKYRELKIKN